MALFDLFRKKPKAGDDVWHQFQTVLPVKLLNGHRSLPDGKMWRRWNGSAWEYQQDELTAEEWLDRQV